MCAGATLSSRDVSDKPNFRCLHLKIFPMSMALPTHVWFSSLTSTICSNWGMEVTVFMGEGLVIHLSRLSQFPILE